MATKFICVKIKKRKGKSTQKKRKKSDKKWKNIWHIAHPLEIYKI